jgi:uncharacterized protein YrrD
MHLNQSDNLFTADGAKVGQIDRVVIDPRTESVTHLVISKGILFDEDKLVPIDLIAAEHTEQIALRTELQREDLPNFEQPPDSEPNGHQPGSAVSAFYWYPLLRASMLPMQGYFQSAYTAETQINIPEGSVAIKAGTLVISSDGQPMGHVAKVLTDFSENRVTHFLLASDLELLGQKLIPVDWIDQWGEDELRWLVGSTLIEILPIYRPARPVAAAMIRAKKKNKTAAQSSPAKPVTKRKRPAARRVAKLK